MPQIPIDPVPFDPELNRLLDELLEEEIQDRDEDPWAEEPLVPLGTDLPVHTIVQSTGDGIASGNYAGQYMFQRMGDGNWWPLHDSPGSILDATMRTYTCGSGQWGNYYKVIYDPRKE